MKGDGYVHPLGWLVRPLRQQKLHRVLVEGFCLSNFVSTISVYVCIDTHIYMYTYINIDTDIYIYIYLYIDMNNPKRFKNPRALSSLVSTWYVCLGFRVTFVEGSFINAAKDFPLCSGSCYSGSDISYIYI